MTNEPILGALVAVVGEPHVLVGEGAQPYLTDWRGRFTGKALAVVRPDSTQQVADVVRACVEAGVPVVAQGGNTGLCGGATPDATGRSVVLLTTRLNRVRDMDTANDTMTVEAGCILQTVQEAARDAGRLFPLSLAAEGSCTIGGNIATNAGGTAVLRYGNMRELTLGLEVVDAEGQVWHGLRGLRKDAENITQSRALWHLRESITLAEAESGKSIKHDISLAISRIAEFLALADARLQERFPGVVNITFGHLGDGNLHYNVGGSERFTDTDLIARQAEIYQLVHDTVSAMGGSISAEHGVGQLKVNELGRYKSAQEIKVMTLLKKALDPRCLLNPGKVLPAY